MKKLDAIEAAINEAGVHCSWSVEEGAHIAGEDLLKLVKIVRGLQLCCETHRAANYHLGEAWELRVLRGHMLDLQELLGELQ